MQPSVAVRLESLRLRESRVLSKTIQESRKLPREFMKLRDERFPKFAPRTGNLRCSCSRRLIDSRS